jgi:hypothetical protein
MFPLSDQAGTLDSAHAAPVEPAADQPGKRKAADPVGRSAALSKSQTLAGKSQSRKGESRKVAQHSRKP